MYLYQLSNTRSTSSIYLGLDSVVCQISEKIKRLFNFKLQWLLLLPRFEQEFTKRDNSVCSVVLSNRIKSYPTCHQHNNNISPVAVSRRGFTRLRKLDVANILAIDKGQVLSVTRKIIEQVDPGYIQIGIVSLNKQGFR